MHICKLKCFHHLKRFYYPSNISYTLWFRFTCTFARIHNINDDDDDDDKLVLAFKIYISLTLSATNSVISVPLKWANRIEKSVTKTATFLNSIESKIISAEWRKIDFKYIQCKAAMGLIIKFMICFWHVNWKFAWMFACFVLELFFFLLLNEKRKWIYTILMWKKKEKKNLCASFEILLDWRPPN